VNTDLTLLPITAMGTIILSSLAISTRPNRLHLALAIELAEISAASNRCGDGDGFIYIRFKENSFAVAGYYFERFARPSSQTTTTSLRALPQKYTGVIRSLGRGLLRSI
jgi:hypothetical protein